MKRFGVVTTIQPPTDCIRRLAQQFQRCGFDLIVVGDQKGPEEYDLPACHFLSLPQQLAMPMELAQLLPTGHYARKNLGYLQAIQEGAQCIYETDDDNAPNSYWTSRQLEVEVQPVSQRSWCNVYRFFTNLNIWPRGFPLSRICDRHTMDHDPSAEPISVAAPIQQGLADGAPDVDAIWRMTGEQDVQFTRNASVWLPPGTWCPFNSQSTWWWPAAYALMYLPSHCSFRMTDIWRSFIAQRCLWAIGFGLVFHASEVHQQRNVHDLMKDFEQEVPGYLRNELLVGMLEELDLSPEPDKVGDNLLQCYQRLIDGEIFPTEELRLVKAWLHDFDNLR